MSNKELIEKFYTSFSEGDYKGMAACYHENIVFQDPAFGKLTGERVTKMWEMLLSPKKEDTKITFDHIQASAENGKAHWTAEYFYGKGKRKVINEVSADFKFKEGKIIQHTDTFDLWKWSRQAIGIKGYLLGWTPFFKRKIQSTTNRKLDKFMKR